MEVSIDAIIVIDQRGIMTGVNDVTRLMFGYRTDELLGENVNLLMPEPDRSAHGDYIKTFLATGIERVIGKGRDIVARRKSGEVFPAHLTIGQIPGCAPPQFVGFVRDKCAQVRREEEARLAQDHLTNVACLATLGEMAAGIAHELAQPLTAINAYARACERFVAMPEPDLAELRDAVREIGTEALRAGDIIRRMRQLVRAEPGARVRIEADALIVDLDALITADARINGTSVRYRLAGGSACIHADSVQLQQLILNLVRNAFEALASQPATSREIEIATATTPGGDVEISVSDNGPGVSPAVAARMFDPFCSTKPRGTGLGLAISRTIAQNHDGRVDYRPISPRGACFYVRLPPAEERET